MIGRADRPPRSWWAVVSFVGGLAAGLLALAALLADVTWAAWWLAALSLSGVATSAVLEARERRRRVFVFDFDALCLRLDFNTPISGLPRTLVVPLADVTAIEAVEQGDGRHALVVDARAQGRLLREVLVANVDAAGRGELDRLKQLLLAATGLSGPAPSSHEPPAPLDTFG